PSTSSVGMSRSFVGSSSTSTSAGCNIKVATRTRACSPPERRPTGRDSCSGANKNRRAPAGDVDRPLAEHDLVALGRERAAERHGRIELRSILVEGGNPQTGGALDASPVGRELAGDEPDEGRLAAALRAEHAEPRSGTPP